MIVATSEILTCVVSLTGLRSQGNTIRGVSRRVFLGRFNWGKKIYPECGWHHPWAVGLREDKKLAEHLRFLCSLLLGCRSDVTNFLEFLLLYFYSGGLYTQTMRHKKPFPPLSCVYSVFCFNNKKKKKSEFAAKSLLSTSSVLLLAGQ